MHPTLFLKKSRNTFSQNTYLQKKKKKKKKKKHKSDRPPDRAYGSDKLTSQYILKILPPNYEKFQIKNSDIFHVSVQNIDCRYSLEPPRRCGSNGCTQSIFFITKTDLYNFDPLKPHFYVVKLGFTRVDIIFLSSAQRHRLWILVRTASSRRF